MTMTDGAAALQAYEEDDDFFLWGPEGKPAYIVREEQEAAAHAAEQKKSGFISPAEQRVRDLLKDLTPQQREAVEHRGGPLVILAGAGTGKTKALTSRIAQLIATGDARPEEILAVTFTNKAARELQRRLKALLDDDLAGLWVGTFHSICARILRENYQLFGIDEDYVILDADDAKRLVKRLCRNRYGKGVEKDVIDYHLEFIEDVRNDPELYDERMDRADADTIAIYQEYEAAKRADKVLDFTDLITTVHLALQFGNVSAEEIAGQWKHFLVDEYQDTNRLQFEWLQMIADGKPDIAVVGDDDQVLYSWRGARIENILGFSDSFADTKVVRLEQNFRSTGYILDAANGVIGCNKKRLGKTLFTTEGQGKPVMVHGFPTAEEEAEWIAAEVEAALSSGMEPTDIAILARASHVLNLAAQKLTFRGIPYVLSGGKRFQDRAEIRDAMAYLRLATNPDDSSSFDRVVNEPKRGMGDVAIKKILDAAETSRAAGTGLSLMDVAENFARSRTLPGDVPAALLEFCRVIKDANKLYWRGANAAELLRFVLAESGYQAALDLALGEAKANGEETAIDTLNTRIANLADLQTMGAEMGPIDLVEQLGLAEDGRSRNATGVWVGTIHAAKGLEWPLVIAVGWEDGVLPSHQALDVLGDALDEERRCAYVEITRARRELHITTTGERFMREAIPSRFLDELPVSAVQRLDKMSIDHTADD